MRKEAFCHLVSDRYFFILWNGRFKAIIEKSWKALKLWNEGEWVNSLCPRTRLVLVKEPWILRTTAVRFTSERTAETVIWRTRMVTNTTVGMRSEVLNHGERTTLRSPRLVPATESYDADTDVVEWRCPRPASRSTVVSWRPPIKEKREVDPPIRTATPPRWVAASSLCPIACEPGADKLEVKPWSLMGSLFLFSHCLPVFKILIC